MKVIINGVVYVVTDEEYFRYVRSFKEKEK